MFHNATSTTFKRAARVSLGANRITQVLLLTAACGFVAQASSLDPLTSFSTSNPDGQWSFGTGTTGGSFTLFSVFQGSTCNGLPMTGLECWTDPSPVGKTPLVALNVSASAFLESAIIPSGELIMHPGPSGDAIVQWTASTAGTYSIGGYFETLDTNPSGVTGEVYDNSMPVYSQVLNGTPATPSAAGGPETFAAVLALAAGDVISFGVNNDGSYFDDATGFSVAITQVSGAAFLTPEPLALSLVGFGLAGISVIGSYRRGK